MASTKRKPRGKIPYIGKPLTASEIKAEYPLTPEMQLIVDRAIAEVRAKRSHRRAQPRTTSAKTARAR